MISNKLGALGRDTISNSRKLFFLRNVVVEGLKKKLALQT